MHQHQSKRAHQRPANSWYFFEKSYSDFTQYIQCFEKSVQMLSTNTKVIREPTPCKFSVNFWKFSSTVRTFWVLRNLTELQALRQLETCMDQRAENSGFCFVCVCECVCVRVFEWVCVRRTLCTNTNVNAQTSALPNSQYFSKVSSILISCSKLWPLRNFAANSRNTW